MKGLSFEQEVYDMLKKSVQQEGFGWKKELCKVFHKKGYFSRDRNKEIITDVSLELYMRGASSPSILWIWECKDYTSSSIPVDDIEEFHSKLEQIGADKTKGTVIARGNFQESALNYAMSKGIGLARWLPKEQVQHIMAMICSSDFDGAENNKQIARETKKALYKANYIGTNREFYAVTGTGYIDLDGTFSSYMYLELK